MPADIHEQRCGASIELNVLIGCSAYSHSNSESREIDINGLAVVKFSFEELRFDLESEIVIKKKPIAGTVKIKVISEDYQYHCESICSEQERRYVMGSKSYNVHPRSYVYFFAFTVTVCAYRAETTALERLYQDTDTTDFHLSTAEGSVPVHKACLVSHSDVFKKMLSREWKETGEGSMQLPGVTLQTLQDLKQYMYLGSLPEEGFLPLLEIASRYLIKDLKEICLSKLIWNVKAEDYLPLLRHSIGHKIPELTFALIQTTPRDTVEKARNINMAVVSDEPKEE